MDQSIWHRIALSCVLLSAASCFYAHPVTGVLPESEDSDDGDGLLALSLLQTGAAAADGGTTPATGVTEIYLFQASTLSPNGNLLNGQATARLGADLRCSTAPPALPVTCGEIRAMITIDAADEIQDMPANYGVPIDQPIYPPGGASLRLAANWTDMLDTGIPLERTLTAAGLGGPNDWWSFSFMNGSISPANCMNGTDPTAASNPGYGDVNQTNTQWIQAAFGNFCNVNGQLLCLCFTP